MAKDYIPALLRQLDRWGLWKLGAAHNGRQTKQPIGSTLGPDWRRPFRDVQRIPRSKESGVGFSMTGGFIEVGPDDYVFCWDCDACYDPATGALHETVRQLLDVTGWGYTEVTPSGTGLRIWFRGPKPEGITRTKVPLAGASMPVGNTKRPEVQLFGTLPGGSYVTVTGEQLAGTSREIHRMDSWEAIYAVVPHLRASGGPVELPPPPSTPAPTVDALDALVQRTEFGRALVKADWPAMLDGQRGSASEAFYRAARWILELAGGHHDVARDYLMHTAWGRGLVEDSADPSKYASERWVTRELARIEIKLGSGTRFEPLADEPPSNGKHTVVLNSLAYKTVNDVELAKRPAPIWIARNYIQAGAVGVMAAEGGAGKSALCIDIALRRTFGVPEWAGERLVPGSTLWFAGEGLRSIGPRGRAWRQHHQHPLGVRGVDGAELIAVDERITALSTERGMERLIATHAAECDRLGALVQLVVLDTMSTLWRGENENDASEVARWVDQLLLFAANTGCSVLLVHHLNKLPPSRKPGPQDGDVIRLISLDAVRGASALRDNTDFVIALSKVAGGGFDLGSIKQRDAELVDPRRFHIQKITIGMDSEGDPITAPVAVDSGKSPPRVVVDCKASAGFERIEDVHRVLAALRDAPGLLSSGTQVGAFCSIPRNDALRALAFATEQGWVVKRSVNGPLEVTPSGLAWSVRTAPEGVADVAFSAEAEEEGVADDREEWDVLG